MLEHHNARFTVALHEATEGNECARRQVKCLRIDPGYAVFAKAFAFRPQNDRAHAAHARDFSIKHDESS
jgi:hypothetical protein